MVVNLTGDQRRGGGARFPSALRCLGADTCGDLHLLRAGWRGRVARPGDFFTLRVAGVSSHARWVDVYGWGKVSLLRYRPFHPRSQGFWIQLGAPSRAALGNPDVGHLLFIRRRRMAKPCGQNLASFLAVSPHILVCSPPLEFRRRLVCRWYDRYAANGCPRLGGMRAGPWKGGVLRGYFLGIPVPISWRRYCLLGQWP